MEMNGKGDAASSDRHGRYGHDRAMQLCGEHECSHGLRDGCVLHSGGRCGESGRRRRRGCDIGYWQLLTEKACDSILCVPHTILCC
jgi:hypothetical protein